jgi:hypothetical protein
MLEAYRYIKRIVRDFTTHLSSTESVTRRPRAYYTMHKVYRESHL